MQKRDERVNGIYTLYQKENCILQLCSAKQGSTSIDARHATNFILGSILCNFSNSVKVKTTVMKKLSLDGTTIRVTARARGVNAEREKEKNDFTLNSISFVTTRYAASNHTPRPAKIVQNRPKSVGFGLNGEYLTHFHFTGNIHNKPCVFECDGAYSRLYFKTEQTINSYPCKLEQNDLQDRQLCPSSP